MPAIKHPCPHCGTWIQRDVAACPACGTRDPFTPARCAKCRRVIEDPSWVACPGCGAALKEPGATTQPGAGTAAAASAAHAAGAPQPAEPPANAARQPAATDACSGCGAPMSAGARFCTVCGTLAS